MGAEHERRVTTRQEIIIGSRGSELALWQTNFVKANLEKQFPQITFSVKIIMTTGDKILDSPLFMIGERSLFTKELEVELLNGGIDMAVHSLKDMQTNLPAGLCIGGVLKREDPRDVLIAKKPVTLKTLPEAAVVATSSMRRRAELLAHRSDLRLVDMRGNLNTRLKHFFQREEVDAMVLAKAGVVRLGLTDNVAEVIDTDVLIPAVGQGAIGVEVRTDDAFLLSCLESISDWETLLCVEAERSFLRTFEGGCQSPIGCHAFFRNEMVIKWFVGSGKEALTPTYQRGEEVRRVITLKEAIAFGAWTAETFLKNKQ